jgi:hypothetical protein
MNSPAHQENKFKPRENTDIRYGDATLLVQRSILVFSSPCRLSGIFCDQKTDYNLGLQSGNK